MRAVAVDDGADVVAGAVGEKVAEAGFADEVAGGVVGLPAGDGLVCGEGVLHGFDGGVAGVADGVEDELFAFGGLAVDDSGPGDVVPDGGGLVGELGPDVDEDEVAFADGAGVGGSGFVVGVGGVGAGADVGAVLPDEVFAGHGLLEVLHHGVLVGAAVAGSGADLLPGSVEDLVNFLLGDVVGG